MIRGDRLLPLPAVESKVGFKHSKLRALIGADEFPPGRVIHGKRLWRESEIDAWIERAWSDAGLHQGEENQTTAALQVEAPNPDSPTPTSSHIQTEKPPPLATYWSSSYLRERYGISRSTLHRWVTASDFPAPAISGGHGSQSRWHADDVMAWEAQVRKSKVLR